MFDEKEIIDAARHVSTKYADRNMSLVSEAFAEFAKELQRVSAEKQAAWEKRHRVLGMGTVTE